MTTFECILLTNYPFVADDDPNINSKKRENAVKPPVFRPLLHHFHSSDKSKQNNW